MLCIKIQDDERIYYIFFSNYFFSCKKNKEIEYLNNGNYKEIKYYPNGDTIISYFLKSGEIDATGYKNGEVETLTIYYENDQTEKGDFKNGKRRGWHSYYDKDGRVMNEIFFLNEKIYQVKEYNVEGVINMENSVYVDIHLPIDTLPHNEEVPVHLRYLNGKSQYEYVRVYVSNEIGADFSNINNVVLDTLGAGPKEKDFYFLVKFPNKGKNYVRGYLFDGVQDDTNLNEFNGIKVLFEKEVYVK